MRRFAFLAVMFCPAFCLQAQNAASFSQFFEGKQVVVRMDMPASQSGVDLYPQQSTPIDLKSYANRMKQYGTSLRSGDTVMITKVKVKDKAIEFQLGGGGYGTFWDDTDTSVNYVPAGKSQREKDLEDQIRNESDPDRRRRLQDQLDYLRRQRERQDQRNLAEAQTTAELKKQRVDAKRQQGGSRFNINYQPRVSSDLTPEELMSFLSQYIIFPPESFGGLPQPDANAGMAGGAAGQGTGDPVASLKKGMSQEDVASLLGAPTNSSDNTQNGMKMTSSTFQRGTTTVQADFVNGVLVKYSISVR